MTYQLRSPTITFEAALRDLTSKHDRTRAMAAHALGDVVEPAERARAVPALIEALRDERPEVRAEAATTLGELESEAAVEPLVARMDDGVPVVRQAAAMALGRLGFASAFDAMAQALRDGAPDLRFQAATSLAEIDPERAREPLLAALEDTDGEVIGAVALCLGAIGARSAADKLTALLEVWSNPRTRFDIAYALADLGDARAVEILAGFVDHKDMAWDAVEALERTALPRAAEPLRPLMQRRLLAPQVKLRAAAAILALTPDDAGPARDALIAGLSARKLEHRGLAIQLLGTVGGSWAMKPLQELRARWAGRRLTDEIDAALAQLQTRS